MTELYVVDVHLKIRLSMLKLKVREKSLHQVGLKNVTV